MFTTKLFQGLKICIVLSLFPAMVYAKTGVVECYGLDSLEGGRPLITKVVSDDSQGKLLGTVGGAEVFITLFDLKNVNFQKIYLIISFGEKGNVVVSGTDIVSFVTSDGLLQHEHLLRTYLIYANIYCNPHYYGRTFA